MSEKEMFETQAKLQVTEEAWEKGVWTPTFTHLDTAIAFVTPEWFRPTEAEALALLNPWLWTPSMGAKLMVALMLNVQPTNEAVMFGGVEGDGSNEFQFYLAKLGSMHIAVLSGEKFDELKEGEGD